MKSDHIKNLDFLVNLHADTLKASSDEVGGVYVARIDIDKASEKISLEVELNEGTIAFSYVVDIEEHDECYNYLIQKLRNTGIKVFADYGDFERALEEYNR